MAIAGGVSEKTKCNALGLVSSPRGPIQQYRRVTKGRVELSSIKAVIMVLESTSRWKPEMQIVGVL
jgi:hypothetical protein